MRNQWWWKAGQRRAWDRRQGSGNKVEHECGVIRKEVTGNAVEVSA